MKKTLLLVSILVSLFTQGMKADEYTTLVEQMGREGVLACFGGSSQYDGLKTMSPKFDEYLEGEYVTQMAELAAPYYRENCSIEELRQMKDYLTSPEMKTVMQNMVKNLNNNDKSMEIDMEKALGSIMSGGDVPAMKQMECSKEYSEALEELFSVMSLDKYAKGSSAALSQTMVKSIRKMMGSFASKVSLGSDADVEEAMAQFDGPLKAMGSYLETNMPTILLNTYILNVSLEDVKTQLKVKDQSFYPAMKRAAEAMYDDMPNFTEKAMDILLPKVTEFLGDAMNSIPNSVVQGEEDE